MQLRVYHDSCHKENKGPVGESLKKEGEKRKERKKRKRERKRDFEYIFLLSVTWTKKIARNEETGGMEKGG